VRFLVGNGLGRAVPFYAAYLPPNPAIDLVLAYMASECGGDTVSFRERPDLLSRQSPWLAAIEAGREREVLLRDADAAGFDVAQLCRLIVARMEARVTSKDTLQVREMRGLR
jgi:hypothetical protein